MKKARFVRFSRARDEYFDGDWDSLAEVALAQNLLVWVRLSGMSFRVAPLGDWQMPTEEARATLEKIRLDGHYPIGWRDGQWLFTTQRANVRCVYLRDHSTCGDGPCERSFLDVPPNKAMDRKGWLDFAEIGHVYQLTENEAWVNRKQLERAIAQYFGEAGGDVPARRWPWGDYETTLLRHLAATADRYWKNYDPAEPDTAETKKTVVAWLVGRGVPERTAEAIDTILRAENLPKGPRKKR